MKKTTSFSAILALALITLLCSCEKEITTIQKPPTFTPLSKMREIYLVDSRQYLVMDLYCDTGNRYNDLPTYMTDDTYQFNKNGISNRFGNQLVNPWNPDEPITNSNWSMYLNTSDSTVVLEWINVVTNTAETYKLEQLKDETCTMILSYFDSDFLHTKMYLKLSKIIP